MTSHHDLHYARYWRGLPTVAKARRPLITRYLESLCVALDNAILEHPRTGIVYLTAHQPANHHLGPDEVAESFTCLLQALINADLERRQRKGLSALLCRVRLIYRTEQRRNGEAIYHLAILINQDMYFPLGGLKGSLGVVNPWWPDQHEAIGSMEKRIQKAWASALRVETAQGAELVRFPLNENESLDAQMPPSVWKIFERLSGMAKAGNSGRGYSLESFGCIDGGS